MPKSNMTKKDLEDIQRIIEKTVERVTRENFEKTINSSLKRVVVTVDRAVEDLNTDREHLSTISINTATTKETAAEILKQLQVNQKKVNIIISEAAKDTVEIVAGAVAEQVVPVMQEAAQQMKNGDPIKSKKKPWWKLGRE